MNPDKSDQIGDDSEANGGLDMLESRPVTRSEKTRAVHDASRALEQGRAYVRACRARGDADTAIAKSLLDIGWTPEEIDELYHTLREPG